jgi:hypothetical protein
LTADPRIVGGFSCFAASQHLLWVKPGSRGGALINFLTGIACRRHHAEVRKPPPDQVFLRVRDVT